MRGISGRALSGGMQGLKERYQRRSLRRTQVIPISRHVAAAFDDLPNELILRESHCNAVERRTSLSTDVADRVAIAALLDLKHERALPLECGCAMNVAVGYWIATPGIHMRTPGRELGHASERAERDRDQQHGNDRNRPSLPAFFSLSQKKWQKNQAQNY